MSRSVESDDVRLRAPAFVKCFCCEAVLEGHSIYAVLLKAEQYDWSVDKYGSVYCATCYWGIEDKEA